MDALQQDTSIAYKQSQQPIIDNHNNLQSLALDYIDQTSSVNPSRAHLSRHTPSRPPIQQILPPKTIVKGSYGTKPVQSHPQYYRVDPQLTAKLYHIYQQLPIVNAHSPTFEQTQENNHSMNYLKILQMVKAVHPKLQVNQKLTILRSIKKFSFNQHLINESQFQKVFKVIVHALNIKEQAFWQLVKLKQAQIPKKMNKRAVSIKVNDNFSRKIKTQTGLDMAKSNIKQIAQLKQHQTIQSKGRVRHEGSFQDSIVNRSKMEEQGQYYSKMQSARRGKTPLGRGRKRIVTQASRYESSYLQRAKEKGRVQVVSWQQLFKMTPATLSSNVSIPTFIDQDLTTEQLLALQ